MPDKKQEPNVYMDNTEALIAGLDNMRERTPEEIRVYRKKIDASRIAVPKKAKKKNEKDTDKNS